MRSKAEFKSGAFAAIQGAAQELHRVATIDKATMREFDESCLTVPPVTPPEEIKRI
jgi:putative transcriptional regulator